MLRVKLLQAYQGTPRNGQSGRYASDDEVYTEVKVCMDLQYSLRPGWVPSDTNKAAFCICNAWGYGGERVKKMIKLWFDQPHSLKYMTLFTAEQIKLINKAKAEGIEVDLVEWVHAIVYEKCQAQGGK